jgi:very-short-patch-repair endonuclease
MSNQSASPDAIVAQIAANQHGVVSFAQLTTAGLHKSVISRRARASRLTRIHRGVYAVGHAGLSQEGRWMAAVLACGPTAVLSHRSAGVLWQILPLPSPSNVAGPAEAHSVIDVTVPGDGGRQRRHGIWVHRSLTLLPGQTTRRGGVPVTKPARTLEDLRRVLPLDRFAATLRQAEFLRLPLGERFEPDHTRSELEGRFLALCRRHRVPKPEVNERVGPFIVDFLWREGRLIVEVDGWESHRTRSAFEADRARNARVKLLGYDVVRFTWRQVTEEGAAVAATVRALLGESTS